MYILFVHHVLFLSSNHLEISIKHSFTASDSRLLHLASACFHFRSIFFTFVGFRLPPFTFRLHSFASVCVRLHFSTTYLSLQYRLKPHKCGSVGRQSINITVKCFTKAHNRHNLSLIWPYLIFTYSSMLNVKQESC